MLTSRIHPSRTLHNLWIKREDELSSGISGSKVRKYVSLLPWLVKESPDEVIVIGSAHSNNVVGLLQRLNEAGLHARPMLLRPHDDAIQGNRLWINMLCPQDRIIWVERSQWPKVNETAEAYAAEKAQKGRKIIVVPEGAAMHEALHGTMTLAEDILHNEAEHETFFPHLFIDSGTGMSAVGLLLGMAMLDSRPRSVHVTLIAGDEVYFQSQFVRFHAYAESAWGRQIDLSHFQLVFYKPVKTPSFGAITRGLMHKAVEAARTEGLLLEPVYSLKHWITLKKHWPEGEWQGPGLWIHNGGAFALSSWQQALAESMA